MKHIIWGLMAGLLLLPGAVLAQLNSLCEGPPFMSYGETVDGEVTNQLPAVGFCFSGQAGDEITIELSRTSGDLDTLLIVFDAVSGDVLFENDDIELGTITDSRLQFTVPVSGDYFVIATRYQGDEGTTTGSFSMTLDGFPALQPDVTTDAPTLEPKGNSGSGGSAPAPAAPLAVQPIGVCADAPVIAYGDTVTGTIDNVAFDVAYCFAGRAGDVITVEMTATSGNLDTLVGVVDPETFDVFVDDDDIELNVNTNSRLTYELPETRTYAIIATRYDQNTGTSTGNFALTLTAESLAQPEVSPDAPTLEPDVTPAAPTQEPKGAGIDGGSGGSAAPPADLTVGVCAGSQTLRYGDTVTGTINDTTYEVVYCFEGQAGDTITAELTATSGDLDTIVAVFDPVEVTLFAENDDIDFGAGNSNSRLTYTLPQAGVYGLLATRFGLEGGDSSGSYTLTLTGPATSGSAPGGAAASAPLCEGLPTTTIGAVQSDMITNETSSFAYCLTVAAGVSSVTVTLDGVSGDLDPLVAVFDPVTGDEIASNDDFIQGQPDSQLTVSVPPGGATFLIIATRYQLEAGTSTGVFELRTVTP